MNFTLLNFNTQKLIFAKEMFSGCLSLKKIDLSSFIMNNINDISAMFWNCISLKEIKIPNIPINNNSLF